jgi:hypothetical protein
VRWLTARISRAGGVLVNALTGDSSRLTVNVITHWQQAARADTDR